MPRLPRVVRAVSTVPVVGLSTLLLTACGGGGVTSDATAAGTDTAQRAAAGDSATEPATTTQPTARQFPGASGTIAEITGSTMQVQNPSNQTAVTWNKNTKITDTVSAKSSDLAIGKCVTVTPTAVESTPTTDDTAPITAASITITDAVDGECGIGGFAGIRPGDPQKPDAVMGRPPQGTPNGARAGAFRGGASGRVVAIDGDTLTVDVRRPAMPAAGATAAPTTEVTTTSRTVTVSTATTWTRTRSADADAFSVGRCVTAVGTASSTGAVSATSIVVRSAVDGKCTVGMMLGRGPVGTQAGDSANTTAGA